MCTADEVGRCRVNSCAAAADDCAQKRWLGRFQLAAAAVSAGVVFGSASTLIASAFTWALGVDQPLPGLLLLAVIAVAGAAASSWATQPRVSRMFEVPRPNLWLITLSVPACIVFLFGQIATDATALGVWSGVSAGWGGLWAAAVLGLGLTFHRLARRTRPRAFRRRWAGTTAARVGRVWQHTSRRSGAA